MHQHDRLAVPFVEIGDLDFAVMESRHQLIRFGLADYLSAVMPGFMPGIHVLFFVSTSKGVDGRDKFTPGPAEGRTLPAMTAWVDLPARGQRRIVLPTEPRLGDNLKRLCML